MILQDDDTQRADAYRVLSDLFFKPPADNELEALKEDLELGSKETAYEIVQDFDNLFLYPGGKVPPLESLHVPGGEAVVNEVTGFYAEAELTIDEEFLSFPDHLSLELLFMSYLIDIKRTELQIDFLDRHLISWVPPYCENVIREARTVFYREIAGLARDFIENEYENLE